MPPVEFDYSEHEWNTRVKKADRESMVHSPAGIDEANYRLTDLFGEGVAGILTEQGGGWFYKHNLGEGRFERARLISPKPSFSGLGTQLQLADLDADGSKQLVNFASWPKGYFELDDDDKWQPLRDFKHMPNIDLTGDDVRMIDLNGNGRPDMLISEDNVFTWYASEGRRGFSGARKTSVSFDEESGPRIVFSETTHTIFLADMSGDGLTDIVRIRNGEVCYWPNLGYGRFGARIAMDNSPLFDHPGEFNARYIRLADIDGSGTTDIIYLGKNSFSCWLNQSGNGFAISPFQIDAFPRVHDRAYITVADLLGSGVPCIVWSSPLPDDAHAPLKYIDLMNSRKPHLMKGYKNNLGKEVTLEYTPSTRFYLDDKKAGRPWITKLHFPVHCISKTITEDKITGYRFVSEYKYHHGYYDHPEREFRGFGMVEQIDAETFANWKKGNAANIVEEPLHQEPVVTKTWFHTGSSAGKNNLSGQFAGDYWYNEMERQGFQVVQNEAQMQDARLIAAPGIDTSLAGNPTAVEWREAMRACKGMVLRNETFARDAVKSGNTPEAVKKELTPFSVVSNNCIIQLLQPKGKNRHAVFTVKESEALTFNYERNTEDPRIAHSLNIKLDEQGNVLESAAVVYPRLTPDPSLPPQPRLSRGKR
jgi:hypothetical protein